jgi:hypothetical protein
MRRILLCCLAAIATTPVSAQGGDVLVYEETFGADAHPLYAFGGVIRFGPQQGDPWVALMREGFLEISNTTDPTVLRYYFLDPDRVSGWEGEPLVARVRVGGTFSDTPSAGLIYGVDLANHSFVALVRTGGAGYGIYVLDGDGYRAIATGASPALVDGEMAELIIAPENGGLSFYVAGQRVYEGPAAQGVGIGVVAAGTGRFRYDDFWLVRRP